VNLYALQYASISICLNAAYLLTGMLEVELDNVKVIEFLLHAYLSCVFSVRCKHGELFAFLCWLIDNRAAM